MLWVVAGSVRAETLQFPDPSMLPPAAQSRDDVPLPPASIPATSPPNTASNSTYVYPQNPRSATSSVQQGVASGNETYVYPQFPATQPAPNTAMPAYNPAQYFSPNALFHPPSLPPLLMPTMPSFAWPTLGYRDSNAYWQGTPYNATSNAANAQQFEQFTQTLNALRQQQSELVGKTQQTLATQEQTIAELKRQLAEANKQKEALEQQLTTTNQGKSDTDSKLTALQAELADAREQAHAATQSKVDLENKLNALQAELTSSVKQAELDSCQADNTHLTGRVTALNSQISALAEVAQHFAQLRQQFASVDHERQQLAAATQRLHDEKEQLASTLAAASQDANTPPPANDAPANDTDEDADNDGVPDAADLCADSAANTEVNPFGCDKNARITLKGVNFEKGAAILTAASLPVLDKAADTLKKHPDLHLEVGGHTDSSGDTATNQKLSQARAERVMQYFLDKGIPAARLSAKGYGATAPLADNSTAAGKAQNRRVELKILPSS